MKYMNRWVYACIGVIVLLFAGLVYAWTVLQAPIVTAFPDWTKGQLSLTFTISLSCFCIGGLASGLLQQRIKPKFIVWISAVLFLAGFIIAAAADSLIMIYLGYGILAGLASGLAYNAVISSVTCWFPDKQGFISGLLLMGFGISSFIVGKIYTAVTPADGSDAWRMSFVVFGIVLFAVMAIAGFFIKKPESTWKVTSTSKTKAGKRTYEEISSREMLKRTSFWLFIIWSTLLAFSGLAIISQGTPMAKEAIPDITMNNVATVVGLIAIFNGVGRIVSGVLFDKVERFWTMMIGSIVFIIAMLLLLTALTNHSMIFLIAAFIGTGLAYGFVPTSNSAFVNLYYGQENYPTNLSIVNMTLLIASFGSTIAGFVFDITNSYVVIIEIVVGLIVVGTIISCFIRKPVIVEESQSHVVLE